jgi:hypothetical protein
VEKPGAANNSLIDRTVGIWQARYSRELSREDVRQIVENVTGFFSILQEWSCAAVSANTDETRHDR